jgi:hypothetical protein
MRNKKGAKPLKTNKVCEMAYFAPLMISTAYDQRRETARFARRKESLRFACFSASSTAKTQGREINGAFGARAADAARVGDSEMAPQAVGIAQNGLGSGAAGSNPWAGESIRRTVYEIPISYNLDCRKSEVMLYLQNRRVEAVGREPVGEEKVRAATRLETFCTQLETRVLFFIFSRVTH